MITELKPIPDIWKRMPSELHARRFLEGIIWSTGRFCPHCGSITSTALRGRTCRPGLYQCRDCRLQFTVTTHTPMHGTKLDQRRWICAMFLALTSSKEISSVVMARLIGVNRKTAWKMGYAIREIMDDRNGELMPLEDIVEVDEAYVGGAPKSLPGAYSPPGKGCGKPMIYEILLFFHVIGATVLLGTGAGIAFFMVISNRSRAPALVAHVASIIELADTVFTATAALVQPITGFLLARFLCWPLLEGWVALSLGLYVFVGIFWLPVVWIQIRMRNLARKADREGQALPVAYHRLYRWWFAFGFPAFAAVLGIVWLMLTKPSIGW